MKDDESKAARLIEELRPLAMSLVLFYRKRLPATVLTEDLEAAAMAGVWDCVRLHPEAGEGLRRYAFFRIKGSIMDYLRSQDWLPRKFRAKMSESMEVRLISLNHMKTEITARTDVESDVAEKMARDRLLPYLRFLRPRERQIVLSHYFHFRTFLEIGEELGVSEPRVSQIHAEAMKRLRQIVPRDLLSG